MIKAKPEKSAHAIERPASPQEPRRLKTRAALMRAGAELLAQRPIDAIAVNDIVDAAGVAKGSFFNHFEDKDAFAAAIAAEIRADVEARVTAANIGVLDPAVRVARAFSGFVHFAIGEPKRARIMLRGQQWATAGDHPLNRGVQADIAHGVATRRFRQPAAAAGVIYVAGLCQMVMMAVVNDRLGLSEARRLTADVLVLALAGLGVADTEAELLISEAIADVVVGL
jgi:AcrR family transcriptional regulator